MSQIACSNATPCSSGPGHTQRATLIQCLVVGDDGRDECARGELDLARQLADGDARELGVSLGSGDRGGGGDLVKREIARAKRMVEGGQIT
jgi:hypothetical protein